MTRQHYFTRVLGWRRCEVRKLLRQADRELRGQGDKTVAKIQRAERVRHCRFAILVEGNDPF